MLSDHSGIKIEIKNRKIAGSQSIQRFNNVLVNKYALRSQWN